MTDKYTEEEIYVNICDCLLMDGEVAEENIEDVAFAMLDKPEIYPEYFPNDFFAN